jgi:hypothetical protein
MTSCVWLVLQEVFGRNYSHPKELFILAWTFNSL